MIDANHTDRRTFLRRGAMGAGAFWTLSLGAFMSRGVNAGPIAGPYGPITPTIDETTGLPLLQLPDGSILVSDDGGNKIWRVSRPRGLSPN